MKRIKLRITTRMSVSDREHASLRGKTQTRRSKPKRVMKKATSPTKILVLPSQSEEEKQEQQSRFDHFLEEWYARQQILLAANRTVVYKIHKEAGLGNMIRGYVTALVVGMMTNRAVVCR